MASLQSDGVAQLSQVTFEKLESKHPSIGDDFVEGGRTAR